MGPSCTIVTCDHNNSIYVYVRLIKYILKHFERNSHVIRPQVLDNIHFGIELEFFFVRIITIEIKIRSVC